jgi:hypothetical protein
MSAKWGFLVYMAGNNSLSGAADQDLVEMRKVGSTKDVAVLVFVAQARQSGTAHRFKVEKAGKGEKVETLKQVDSGDPQTVIDFIRWGMKQAPAERYAVVLWNHGGGWSPLDLDQLYSQVRGIQGDVISRREMNHRAAQPIARTFFSTSVKEILSRPTERERAILSDDGTGHSLDTIELGRVLKLARKEVGRKIDLLAMDACLMSTLEVAYEVSDDVGVVVGSEEPEPGAGWDYSTLLSDLTANPAMDAAELGRKAVACYIESYQKLTAQWPVTQCAIDASRIDGLCQAVDALEGALRPRMKEEWSKILTVQKNSVMLDTSFRLVDLASLCQNLTTAPLGEDIQNAANAVLEALRPGDYVIAEGHLGPEVDGCGGVSVYMPGPLENVSPYYKDLAFAQSHRWSQFLQEYHASV